MFEVGRPARRGARGRAPARGPRAGPQRGRGNACARGGRGAGVKSGFVSLVGLPNAGKSTLLNRLVGTKLAIVSDKPQTTRNRILGVRNYPEGQVVYVDTPGYPSARLHRMNVRMLDTARDAMRDVDVVGVVLDVSQKPGGGQRHLFEMVRQVPTAGGARPEQGRSGREDEAAADHRRLAASEREFADIVPVSALTGDNVDRLEQVILSTPAGGRAALSRGLPDGSTRALLRRRDGARAGAAAHACRAAVFDGRRRRQVRGAGREKGLMRLYCSILVERESQKPIVIGRARAR